MTGFGRRGPRRGIRLAATVAFGTAAVLAVSGCAGGGGGSAVSDEIEGTITLQTWALTPTYTDYLNGVIDAFEAEYPGTTVELVDQPGDGYGDKVLSQATSNSLPDVINLPPDIAYPLARRGFLADVGADADLADTYVPGAVEAYQYAGLDGTWGYPWYLNTDISYWNAQKLSACGLDPAAVPATTDELFEQAAVMHDTCPDEYLMSRKPGLGDFTLAGVDVMNDDGTAFTFADDPASAELIQTYADAFQNGLMPPSVLNSDYLGNSVLFTQGAVAWTTGGATAVSDFQRDNPSLRDNIVVSPALNTPPLYVQGVSVSAKSQYPATARALAEFLTNAENQLAFAQIVNIFPSTISSQSDPFFSESDGTVSGDAKVLANEALKTAQTLTPVQATPAMNVFLDQQIALAMRGDADPEEALTIAQERMNTLLADG